MNRYTQLTPSTFSPLSLQEQMMVPLARQKAHDAGLDESIKGGLFDVNRLSVDDELVSGEIQNFQQQFQQLQDDIMNKGINSDVTKRLLKLKREREMALSNTGNLGKAKNAYDSYQSNLKYIRNNKTMSEADKQLFSQTALNRYKGIGEEDTYNPYFGASSVDINQKSLDIAKNIPVQQIKTLASKAGWYDNGDGTWRKGTKVTRNLKASYIQEVVEQGLSTDRNVQAYLQALNESGVDTSGMIGNAGVFAGNARQVNDVSIDQDLRVKAKNKTTTTTDKPTPGVVSFVGDLTTAKRRWGSMKNLRNIATNEGDPNQLYAQRTLDQMTAHVMNLPKNQEIMQEFKNQMEGLPDDLKTTGYLTEWAKATQLGAVNKKQIHQIDGKNYVTAISKDQNISVFEVSDETVEHLNSGKIKGNPYEFLNNSLSSNFKNRYAKKKTDVSLKKVNDELDSYFEKKGAPSTKYSLDRLKPTERKEINENGLNIIRNGGMDNFELLNIYSGNAGDEIEIEDFDKRQARKKEIFDTIKSGNVKDFKIDSIYYDSYSGLPAARISFLKQKTNDKEDDQYYEIDVSIDNLKGKTGVKSGESALLNMLKDYGGKEGDVIHNFMENSIRYKNVVENYDQNDFDNSERIKQILPEHVYSGNKKFLKRDDELNIWNSEGQYRLMVKGKGGNSRALKWKDLVTSEELSDLNPKDNPDFYKAIIKHAINRGHVDESLNEVMSYDDNNKPYFDGDKMDSVIKSIIDFDDEVTAEDKIVLLNIIRSSRK